MCYHHFWLDQYYDKNAWMLSASLIQLEYASKQWKSTFSYCLDSVLVDYLSQNNLGELLRLAETLASKTKARD